MEKYFDNLIDFLFKATINNKNPYHGVMIAILTIIIVWMTYRISKSLLNRYLHKKAFKKENIKNFLALWRYIWMGLGTVFVIISLSGSIASLGLSTAFFTMIFAWTLQDLVKGVAGWFVVIIKKPFKIGDRITIHMMNNKIIGEVQDITLTHTILHCSDDDNPKTTLMVPNSYIFLHSIENHLEEEYYIRQELIFPLTKESNMTLAEELIQSTTQKHINNFGNKIQKIPYIYTQLKDSSIQICISFYVLPDHKDKISSDLTKAIISKIMQNDQIHLK